MSTIKADTGIFQNIITPGGALPSPLTAYGEIAQLRFGEITDNGVGAFIGVDTDNDQTNLAVGFGSLDSASATNSISGVLIQTGSLTGVAPTGNIYDLSIIGGNVEDAINGVSGGNVSVAGGNASNGGAGGSVSINGGYGLGAGVGNGGDLFFGSGGSNNGGTSGSIELAIGTTSGTPGQIRFIDGSEGTAGYVWTSTDTSGNGAWMPGGGSSVLANNVYLQGRNAANTTDLDIVRISTSDFIELGHPNTSEGIEIQSNQLNIWGSHISNSGEVWIRSHVTRLYNPPASTTAPYLLFGNTAGTFGVSIKADNSLPADITFTLPPDTGTSGYVLSTDGSGILSWIASAGSFSWATPIDSSITVDTDSTYNLGAVGAALADIYASALINTGGLNYLDIDSGQVALISGDGDILISNNDTTGQPIVIQTAAVTGVTSGLISITTGTSDTTTGDASILSGAASGSAVSGNVLVASGGTSTGASGNVLVTSGDVNIGASTSGALTLSTGTSNGISGQVNIFSGLTGGAGGSGVVSISTGMSAGAMSGGVLIASGQSDIETGQVQMTSGGTLADDVNSGDAAIRTGSTSGTGTTGHIRLATGSGVPSTANSGSIILTTGDATVRGSINLNAPTIQTFDSHLRTFQDDPPVATVNANAGTGATSTVANATDIAGIINLTTTAVAPAAGAQTSIAFDQPYATAPIVVLTPRNADTANFSVSSGVYVTTTTTTMEINFATADAVGHAYSWFYHVIETQ